MQHTPKRSFITQILFYSCFIFITAHTLTINQHAIRDLESTTLSSLQTEALNWQITNQLDTTSTTTTCASTALLGGSGVIGIGTTFSRTYTSLPDHEVVHLALTFTVLDLEEQRDIFDIYIDSVLIGTWTISDPGSPSICGGTKNDYPTLTVQAKVPHTQPNLTLQIVSLYNNTQDTFSFGFRDVSLLFKIPASTTTVAACFFGSITGTEASCLCPQGYYDNPGNSVCKVCMTGCKSCLGATTENCTSCKAGYSFNGIACFKCDSSCSDCKGILPTDCLSCAGTKFLYADGTCKDTCVSPYVSGYQGTNKICFTCGSSNYVYQNNSCLPNCSSPYVERIVGNSKYCDFPCNSTSYLYWNNTCQDTCPLSFQTTFDGYNTCAFYCDLNSYLYHNQTCVATCDYPLQPSADSQSYQFCSEPCPDGGIWQADNQTCVATCDSPFVLKQYGDVQTCEEAPVINDPTNNTNITSIIQSISAQENDSTFKVLTDKVISGASIMGSVLRPNNPNSVFLIALAKMVKYVKYIDISLPQNVKQAFDSQNSSVYSISTMFVVKMPASLQDKFDKDSLPTVFQGYGLYSSYLANQWESLSSFIIIFGIGLFFLLLDRLIKNLSYNTPKAVIKKLKVLTQWNLLLLLIFNSYDDLAFFFFIELQTLHLNSFLSFLSFFTCLIVTAIALFLPYKVYKASREAIRLKTQIVDSNSENPSTNFYKKWKTFQVTFSGYKDNSFITKSFLLVCTCRITLCYIIVACLYSSPLAQTMFFVLFSLAMFYYLLKLRPVNDTFSFCVILWYETLVLTVNLCLLILAILQVQGSNNTDLKENIAHAILVTNTLIDFCSNVVTWTYILIGLKATYKTSKIPGKQKRIIWLNMLLCPYQGPGLDFDDRSNDEFEVEEMFSRAVVSPEITEKARNNNVSQQRQYRQMLSLVGSANTIDDLDTINTQRKDPGILDILSSPENTERGKIDSLVVTPIAARQDEQFQTEPLSTERSLLPDKEQEDFKFVVAPKRPLKRLVTARPVSIIPEESPLSHYKALSQDMEGDNCEEEGIGPQENNKTPTGKSGKKMKSLSIQYPSRFASQLKKKFSIGSGQDVELDLERISPISSVWDRTPGRDTTNNDRPYTSSGGIRGEKQKGKSQEFKGFAILPVRSFHLRHSLSGQSAVDISNIQTEKENY